MQLLILVDKIKNFKFIYLPCFAHSLNLAVGDVLKPQMFELRAESDLEDAILNEIAKIFKKSTKICWKV